ncbi:MAG TPA: DHA2 family efflux MFS transporter permease subunit [Methylomirabilota bacterium]|jgi:DHA2 family multidrug resistance protein|nr:DHA2 family efflux MFS transporter permease subunit [Methylomirabilota bacterium]
MSPAPAAGAAPAVNPWLVAVSVMLATFMEVLDTSVANVALPHIAGSLSASTDESTWVLTSYLVSNAIVLPATAWLSSLFGRKRFLLACIVTFTLASVLAGAAPSLGMLIVARVLQGAGGGALQPISQAVLLESFPPERRGVAMAAFGMGVVVAPILGPTLGGWITDNYSWRWIFYINLPVGILAILMVRTFLEDPAYIRGRAPRRIDWAGLGLLALWLGVLQVVLDKGQEVDWFASGWLRVATVVIVLAFAAFLIRELRTADPIVELRVLRDRNFAGGVALITVVGFVLYGTVALLPLFLQTLMGYPALQSGYATSPRGIGSIVAMVLVGRLVGRLDTRYLITTGFGLLALSVFMLGRINLDISMASVAWPQVLNGLALGFIFVPLTASTTGTLPKEQIGNATGIFNLMRNVGGSVGISLVTTILARHAQQHQALLTRHITPYDPAAAQWLAQAEQALAPTVGAAAAADAARAALYNVVLKQSMLLAFVDVFRLLAVLVLCCIPIVWLFRRTRAPQGPVAAH